MKVENGVWVVKIAHDYSWGTVYGKYSTLEKANKCGYFECDYDEFKVRFLHEGEELPHVGVMYGI